MGVTPCSHVLGRFTHTHAHTRTKAQKHDVPRPCPCQLSPGEVHVEIELGGAPALAMSSCFEPSGIIASDQLQAITRGQTVVDPVCIECPDGLRALGSPLLVLCPVLVPLASAGLGNLLRWCPSSEARPLGGRGPRIELPPLVRLLVAVSTTGHASYTQ